MNYTTSHSCILHSLTSYLYTRNYYRIFITMSHLAIASLLSNIIIIIILLSLCFLALLSCTYMTWTLSYSLASSTSDSCQLNAILRNIQITCIGLFCLLSYLKGCPYDYDLINIYICDKYGIIKYNDDHDHDYGCYCYCYCYYCCCYYCKADNFFTALRVLVLGVLCLWLSSGWVCLSGNILCLRWKC
jgi:hypothetical protein